MSDHKMQVETTDRVLIMTRFFNAPRELVFEAYSSCGHLKNWWGPKEWPMDECTIDFRPGGEWLYCLRGPNAGDESWGKAIYKEIVEPERIVYADYFSDADGNINQAMPAPEITMTFEPYENRTKLTGTARYPTAEALKTVLDMGMVDGMGSSLDRLEEHLGKLVNTKKARRMNKTAQKQATGDRDIVQVRTFDAPRELVFDAWTAPEKIGRWWGPDGFTTTTFGMDFRPGGMWKFVMHGPDGTDYPNRIVYSDIVEPERLMYAHGESEDNPAEFHTTVTFDDIDGSRTQLTMRMVFTSKEARDKTVEEHHALEGGKQTLARLAAFLEQV